MPADQEWRLALYRDLAIRLNQFFADFLGPYCADCARVMARLPEAREEAFELVEGIYPGCCHRGAGDIFRLEGQPLERSRLAPEIIAGLQRERGRRLAADDTATGGSYTIRLQRDRSLLTGAHCRYFSARGCTLGELKGPLCINFICPPLRNDLLTVCRDEVGLVGPEHDFLFIYRTLASFSWDDREAAQAAGSAFRHRLERLATGCRVFLEVRNKATLYQFFMPAG